MKAFLFGVWLATVAIIAISPEKSVPHDLYVWGYGAFTGWLALVVDGKCEV